MSMVNQKNLFLLTLVFFSALLHQPARATASEPDELRASFLYHIAHYTIYPENNQPDTFNFCFYESEDNVHSAIFNGLPKKQVKERDVQVLKVDINNDAQLKPCQLLFINQHAETKEVYARLEQLNKRLVTVGETRGFVENGGLLTIVPLKSKMKIFISKQQFENTPLKFSSLLLKRASFR